MNRHNHQLHQITEERNADLESINSEFPNPSLPQIYGQAPRYLDGLHAPTLSVNTGRNFSSVNNLPPRYHSTDYFWAKFHIEHLIDRQGLILTESIYNRQQHVARRAVSPSWEPYSQHHMFNQAHINESIILEQQQQRFQRTFLSIFLAALLASFGIIINGFLQWCLPLFPF